MPAGSLMASVWALSPWAMSVTAIRRISPCPSACFAVDTPPRGDGKGRARAPAPIERLTPDSLNWRGGSMDGAGTRGQAIGRLHSAPKLETGDAGGLLHDTQGGAANAWFKDRIEERSSRADERRCRLFLPASRTIPATMIRLLASVAPSSSGHRRARMSRRERAIQSRSDKERLGDGLVSPWLPTLQARSICPSFSTLQPRAAEQGRKAGLAKTSLPPADERRCRRLYALTARLVDGERVARLQERDRRRSRPRRRPREAEMVWAGDLL